MPAYFARRHPMLVYLLFVVSFLAVCFGGYSIATTIRSSRHERQSICQAVNNIDTVIQAQLRRSLVNIPKLTYYRMHPRERDQQLAEVRREIRAFEPRHCH